MWHNQSNEKKKKKKKKELQLTDVFHLNPKEVVWEEGGECVDASSVGRLPADVLVEQRHGAGQDVVGDARAVLCQTGESEAVDLADHGKRRTHLYLKHWVVGLLVRRW